MKGISILVECLCPGQDSGKRLAMKRSSATALQVKYAPINTAATSQSPPSVGVLAARM